MMRMPAGGSLARGGPGGRAGPPPHLTNGGPDERGRVADVVETLLLDELGHGLREALVVRLDVVLQDQAAERPRRLVWGGGEPLTGGCNTHPLP